MARAPASPQSLRDSVVGGGQALASPCYPGFLYSMLKLAISREKFLAEALK